MLLGYARVSTHHQDTQSQRHALEACGVHPAAIYEESESGRADLLPVLQNTVNKLQPGDVLVVVSLDRLTRRGVGSLHAILDAIKARGARLKSLSQPWCDPASPAYDLLVSMAGYFAQMEAERINERARAGLEAARSRGVKVGRRRSLSPDQERALLDLLSSGRTPREVAAVFRVSESTVFRAKARQAAAAQ